MFDFVLFNKTSEKSYGVDFFKKTLTLCWKEVGQRNQKFGLSINLVGPSAIKSLNNGHRQKNRVTDVLSFPLNHEKIYSSKIKTSNDVFELGDLFICPAEARRKSRQNGFSMDREMKFLTVHGLLHLLGYDHEKSAKEKSKMFSIQNNILSKMTK